MAKTPLLIFAGKKDAVAKAFARYARKQGSSVLVAAPNMLWRKLLPQLRVSETGEIISGLGQIPVFNRVGTLREEAWDAWSPDDRHYAAMESSAALLAFLACHPAVVNRPKPHDFSGCGLRSVEQLTLGRSLGLQTPAWLATSELGEALDFLSDCHQTAIYRKNSEDIFDFPLATQGRLPIKENRLTTAVFLINGHRGYPIVSTYAFGRVWHFNPVEKKPVELDGQEGHLRSFFDSCGLDFGQAIGIKLSGSNDYVFYGATGFPQYRFYRELSQEIHEILWKGIGGLL